MWRLDWSWKSCFQDGALTWLWARLLTSLSHGSSLGLLDWPHNMAASGPPRAHGPREQDRSCNIFDDLATEFTLHHFCSILLVTQVSPVQCERGPYGGVNTKRYSWGASWRLTTITQAKGHGGQRGCPAGHSFIHSSFNDHLCWARSWGNVDKKS